MRKWSLVLAAFAAGLVTTASEAAAPETGTIATPPGAVQPSANAAQKINDLIRVAEKKKKTTTTLPPRPGGPTDKAKKPGSPFVSERAAEVVGGGVYRPPNVRKWALPLAVRAGLHLRRQKVIYSLPPWAG